MPRPQDPMDLISASAYPQGWQDEFGPYKWFYLVGFQEVCALAKLHNTADVRNCVFHARQNIPQSWPDLVPAVRWDDFSPKQIDDAASLDAMRLDKCYLTLLALEECLRVKGIDIDVYDLIEVRPSWFKLDGFDEDVSKIILANGLALELQRELHHPFPDDFHVIKECAEGRAVTEEIADRILNFLNQKNIGKHVTKRIIQDRVDGGIMVGKKTPSKSQANMPINPILPNIKYARKRSKMKKGAIQ